MIGNASDHRVARSFHTAWIPPAYPNSLVLLGGGQSTADLSVEVLPSDTLGRLLVVFDSRHSDFPAQMLALFWNMEDMELVGSQMEKLLS